MLRKLKLILGVEEDVVRIIRYGNFSGSDIDLFVVTRRDSPFSHIVSEELDITMVGEASFVEMLHLFHPIVTEPVLHGVEVVGSGLEKLKEQLLSLTAGEQITPYLRQLAKETSEGADYFFANGDLDKAITNIVFALSYREYSEVYRAPIPVMSFSTLLRHHEKSLLGRTYCYYKKSRIFSSEEIARFLEETKRLL